MGGKSGNSSRRRRSNKEKHNKNAHKVEINAKHQIVDGKSKNVDKFANLPVLQHAVACKTTVHHDFAANALDHCETPMIAYQHIEPVLIEMAKICRVEPMKLRIWDPFYCDGAAKRHLEALGFEAVIHENKDFYELIQTPQTLPPHDVFLTNPPYSDDHIESMLQYLSDKEKPFALLMPNWVARKRDYASLMPRDVFYLSPVQPYTYNIPEWNSKPAHVGEDGATTPYLSSWYIHVPEHNEKLREVLDSKSKKGANFHTPWVVAKTIKGLKWKIQKLK